MAKLNKAILPRSQCSLDKFSVAAPLKAKTCRKWAALSSNMNRVQLLLFCILFSTESIALSISCPIDNMLEGNSSDIEISYKADEDTWIVLVKAPSKMEELKFSRLMLVKGSDGNLLAVPLESKVSGGIVEAHFYANELMLNGMSLSVSYGNTCPKSITIPLELNNTLNADAASGAG